MQLTDEFQAVHGSHMVIDDDLESESRVKDQRQGQGLGTR